MSKFDANHRLQVDGLCHEKALSSVLSEILMAICISDSGLHERHSRHCGQRKNKSGAHISSVARGQHEQLLRVTDCDFHADSVLWYLSGNFCVCHQYVMKLLRNLNLHLAQDDITVSLYM